MIQVTKNERGLGVVEIMLVIIITAVILVVGWMIYNDNDHASTASSTTKAGATSATSLFKVPQLGIEVTVPSSLSDIEYSVDKNQTLSTGQRVQSVTLSTATITKLDADCGVHGAAPPLGTISKTQGKYPTNPDVGLNNASGALIKQFPTYYIAWQSPQGACSSSISVNTKALAETNLFGPALKSVQPLQ